MCQWRTYVSTDISAELSNSGQKIETHASHSATSLKFVGGKKKLTVKIFYIYIKKKKKMDFSIFVRHKSSCSQFLPFGRVTLQISGFIIWRTPGESCKLASLRSNSSVSSRYSLPAGNWRLEIMYPYTIYTDSWRVLQLCSKSLWLILLRMANFLLRLLSFYSLARIAAEISD